MPQPNPTHAIVIGGSIAGMLNARVLSDHFDTVTIVERDTIEDAPEFRNGAPQGRHLHALLARGQRIMEGMFPGLADDIHAAGAQKIRWGLDTHFITIGGEMPRYDAGFETHLISRLTLEHLVRRRMLQIGNIAYRTQTQVDELLSDGERITGAKISQRRTRETETLHANLVIDASGRGSKSAEWLQALGYDAPEETFVNAHVGYATRWYTLPEEHVADWLHFAIQADVANGNYRQGGIFHVENNQFVLTLQGSAKDYPPTDEAGFEEFARTLPAPDLYDFIQLATPVSQIYGYRRTENRLRHYERLTKRPENYLVTGDAVCAFNPIFGQGMSMAAMEAEMLSELLPQYDDDLTGLAETFQKRLRQLVESSWTVATAEDMRYPETEGDEPGLKVRFMQHYSEWISETICHDRVVANAFFEMFNLLRSADDLAKPNIFARVIWHKFIRPKARRVASSTETQALRRVTA